MVASDDQISDPASSSSDPTLDELVTEIDKLFEARLSLMDSATTQILIDSTRGERDRLLIIAFIGLAISTVATPLEISKSEAGKVSFEILDLKLTVASSVFHYGLASIIFYFLVTFSLMAYLDVEKWRLSLSSKWLPFEDQNTRLIEAMLRKYQSIVDNAKYMKEQIDVYHAKDATLDAQVADLEVELRSAHEAGDIAVSREISKKITALYDEHDMPELRPLQKESYRLVAQMRSIATRLEELRKPVIQARQLSRLQVIIYIASPIIFAVVALVLVVFTANR
jgi:hypothetical protein